MGDWLNVTEKKREKNEGIIKNVTNGLDMYFLAMVKSVRVERKSTLFDTLNLINGYKEVVCTLHRTGPVKSIYIRRTRLSYQYRFDVAFMLWNWLKSKHLYQSHTNVNWSCVWLCIVLCCVVDARAGVLFQRKRISYWIIFDTFIRTHARIFTHPHAYKYPYPQTCVGVVFH